MTWALVAAWGVWTIGRLFGLERGYPLAAMMAFTPYVALTALIPLGVAVVLRRWAAAVVAGAIVVALAAAVLPRAFGGPTEPDGSPGPTLRVLAANMKLGKADPDALVGLVRELDVDVLSVEELTGRMARRLDRLGLRELLPERELLTGRGSRGSGVYAAGGLGSTAVTRLDGGFPLIVAAFEAPGAPPTEVLGVHTAPPTADGRWRSDLEHVPRATSTPLRIPIGDFNATLDHDAFRELLDSGYDDAGATLGDGLTPTWPTDRRVPPLVTIDHVLADERIGIRDYSVHDVPGSDHRAVYAELQLPAA